MTHPVGAQEIPDRTVQAVDWSKFQRGHTLRDMQALRDAGVELVIVGGWHGDAIGANEKCAADLALARASGLRTALYIVVDGPEKTGPSGAVHKGVEACGAESAHVSFIAVDVEVKAATMDGVAQAATVVRMYGKTPILYTAHWFWHGKLGNPHANCDLPLWNAFYDGNPDIDFERRPYGCWTPDMVIAEQYTDKSNIPGLTLDHNTFSRDFLESLDAAQTPTPAPRPVLWPAQYLTRLWFGLRP
jgi:hypothetical protein